MRVPAGIQRVLCGLGLHRFNKSRRIRGFLVRRCGECGLRQEQDFPGGGWRTVALVKRARRPKAPATAEPDGKLAEQEGLS